jgi:hypothetical protein
VCSGRVARFRALGVYSTDLVIPLGAFAAGLGDAKIITTLCPGGKERMRRLMDVIASGRVDLTSMVPHRYKLDDIEKAYDLFSHQRDGGVESRYHSLTFGLALTSELKPYIPVEFERNLRARIPSDFSRSAGSCSRGCR